MDHLLRELSGPDQIVNPETALFTSGSPLAPARKSQQHTIAKKVIRFQSQKERGEKARREARPTTGHLAEKL
jgi:hypothetical protein